ncbi:uncharacterized protein LOC128224199 isoform X2 [Mya arenaria]|nr:uncharacterized protein LOC128224199 isoform X2 [Mya arenaria]
MDSPSAHSTHQQDHFYTELYRKYPHAFRRRLEARDAGRQLFNSRHHVRFKDEINDESENSVHLHNGSVSARTLTNWDKEVGHYFRQGQSSRSQERLNSDCEGSEMSVKQRLRMNSKHLNNLLNEGSPFRKRKSGDHVQYDSGMENGQSLQDYMLEKSKERSRHRKKHHRIIIQRKITKDDDRDENKENEIRQRRWMSKSASPVARNRLTFNPYVMSLPRDNHHVDVDALISNTDLQIDTVLENINIAGQESPPDSAIDIGTPSVQSLVTTGRGVPFSKSMEKKEELPSPDSEGGRVNSGEIIGENVESSPGSSASACVRNSKTNEENQCTNSESIMSNVDINKENETVVNTAMNTTEPAAVAGDTCRMQEINEINKLVEEYMLTSEHIDQLESRQGEAGLLQIFSKEMGYDTEHSNYKCNAPDINSDFSDQNRISESVVTFSTGETLSSVKGAYKDNTAEGNDDGMAVNGSNFNNRELTEANYHADDEREGEENVAMEIRSKSEHEIASKKTMHKDSDVDSGIGHSSTCTESLPPRGRGKSRGVTMKPQPVRADHSILPLRSDVDVDIAEEVDLIARLSHDLVRGGNPIDKGDDTDFSLGTYRESMREKKVAEKYRKARSPSPFILLKTGQSAYSRRPLSAPSFVKSDTDMKVVDISLCNESLSDLSSNISSPGGINSHSMPNRTKVSCEYQQEVNTAGKVSVQQKYASTPNLTKNDIHRDFHNNDYDYHNPVSSNVQNSKHQKHSVTSLSSRGSSMSPISESDSDQPTQIYKEDYHTQQTQKADNDSAITNQRHAQKQSELNHKPNVNGNVHHVEATIHYNTDHVHSDQHLQTGAAKITDKRGVFKPGVTSPRVKEKRLKLRNILKNKKGSFNPIESESWALADERNVVNRIYAKDRGPESDSNHRRFTDTGMEQTSNHGDGSSVGSHVSWQDSIESRGRNGASVSNTESTRGASTPSVGYSPQSSVEERLDLNNSQDHQNTEGSVEYISSENGAALTNSGNSARNNSRQSDTSPLSNSNTSIGGESPQKALPPKKPARTKQKSNITDLNFSNYKIKTQNGQQNPQPMTSSTSGVATRKHPAYGNTESPRPVSKEAISSVPLQHHTEDIIAPQDKHSTLAESREKSASRGSLLEKTKGKLRKFRNSVSLENGLDSAGVDGHPGGSSLPKGSNPNKPAKGGHSFLPLMKKAPSLKSLTSLFKRKKKKGKFNIEDSEQMYDGSTLTLNSVGTGNAPLSARQRQQWSSCHTLPSNTPTHTNQPINMQQDPTHPITGGQKSNHPIGRLQRLNPDGSQQIQLVKPDDGPLGFFISKGNAKFGNGVFVSRFSTVRPERSFAGLLNVGDEILEVNGHPVRDLSQDAVYELISASPVIVMKVLPFIARTDV